MPGVEGAEGEDFDDGDAGAVVVAAGRGKLRLYGQVVHDFGLTH
jgi:hypothetical protein